jgi:HEAT repeat protein
MIKTGKGINMKTLKILTTLCFIVILVSIINADNSVIKHQSPQESLTARWEWVQNQVGSMKGGLWVGYSFQQLMGKNSFIRSFEDSRSGRPTLEMILEGKVDLQKEESVSDAAREALQSWDNTDKQIEVIAKDVAILFYFNEDKINFNTIHDVKINSLNLPVNLKGKPLLWLGDVSQKESVAFLKDGYKKVKSPEIKEDLVTAIGLHRETPATHDFLSGIIDSDENDDIREKAVFWLGQADNEDALKILVNTIEKDRSDDIREQAVFAISQMKIESATSTLLNLARQAKDSNVREKAVFWLGQQNSQEAMETLKDIIQGDASPEVKEQAVFALGQMQRPEATDMLIDLARNARDRGVQTKAIFWLGQKASDNTNQALEDIAYEDDEGEVQKAAVFALSQLPADEAVPSLIKIAQGHPNSEVRKNAIFWLGQSGDERAIDALVEMVKKK